MEWSLRLNLTQHGETHQGQDLNWIDRPNRLFLDLKGGGAWPFLVGGATCLVNSDNERDLSLLTSPIESVLPSRGARAGVKPCACAAARCHRGLVVVVPFAGEGCGLASGGRRFGLASSYQSDGPRRVGGGVRALPPARHGPTS
jgi:hypothetical protein